MFPDRLLLTAEAEGGGDTGGGSAPAAGTTDGGGNGAAPAGNGAPAPAWYAPAESLKTTHPDVWTSFENGIKSGQIKDLPSFVLKGIGAEKRLGTSLTPPEKGNAEQAKEFKDKLVKAGVDLRALASEAPATPDKYDVKALDAIPEPMRSAPLIEGLRGWAHKHGLSQEAVGELLQLEAKRYEDVVKPALAYTAEQGEKAIVDYSKSIGKEPEVVKAWAGRWLSKNFTEEEIVEMEKSGFANSPVALKYAARAGLDTGEDISVMEGSGGATDTEYEELENKLGDRTSPEYKLLYQADPQDPKRQALMAKREALMKRKYGTGEVS